MDYLPNSKNNALAFTGISCFLMLKYSPATMLNMLGIAPLHYNKIAAHINKNFAPNKQENERALHFMWVNITEENFTDFWRDILNGKSDYDYGESELFNLQAILNSF